MICSEAGTLWDVDEVPSLEALLVDSFSTRDLMTFDVCPAGLWPWSRVPCKFRLEVSGVEFGAPVAAAFEGAM